jgi:predicted metal-dependent hydrolase
LKINQIVQDISNQQNLQFAEIKISNNKATWGSCSSAGRLFFSWRLIFVPLETLYYVIVHEMCHLVEMNHSSKFWNLVSTLCPDYKAHKLWLKENSYRLHQYSSNLNLLPRI